MSSHLTLHVVWQRLALLRSFTLSLTLVNNGQETFVCLLGLELPSQNLHGLLTCRQTIIRGISGHVVVVSLVQLELASRDRETAIARCGCSIWRQTTNEL